MKPPKEIPRKSAKIKRGSPFIIKATGEEAKFHILRPDGRYLLWFPESDIYNDFAKEEVKEYHPGRQPIKQVVRPVSPEEKKSRESLDDFFDRIALTMPFNCMECGKPLYANTKFFKRCVTAHILPKAEFPSIATDPANIFYLGWAIIGVCTHHDDWDRKGAENRTKMKVYDIAINRFETDLKFKLTDHELVKAYTYLSIKWQ